MNCKICCQEMFRGRGHDYKCIPCDAFFIDIDSYHPSYDPNEVYDEGYASSYHERTRTELGDRLAMFRASYFTHLPFGSRVLDFGCATGPFVIHMRKAGYDCFGYDVNENLKNFIPESVLQYFLLGDSNPFEHFKSMDGVAFFDVLEHIPDVGPFLLRVKAEILKPGAFIVIAMPNAEGQSVKDYPNRFDGYRHYKTLEHYHLWTPKTVERIAEKMGAKLVSIDNRESLYRVNSDTDMKNVFTATIQV